ncbi:MAG: sugar ABC transporter permease [Clostridiales bacterium]|nr:sugar ABC transporter permease [Clostridiales bacterium]
MRIKDSRFAKLRVFRRARESQDHRKKNLRISDNHANRWLYPKSDMLFLIPQLAGFSLFYVYAFLLTLRYSVLENNAQKVFVGLKHYINVIENPYFQLAFLNTIKFSVISVLLSLALGYGLSLLVFWHPCFKWITNLGLFALFLPTSALMMIWRILMSDHGTLANNLYTVLPRVFSSQMWPGFSLYIFFLWRYLGISVLVYFNGLVRIEQGIIESATIEGAGGWLISWRILLPLLRRTTMFNMVYMTVCSLRMFREVYLLYGAYPPQDLYFVQHYLNNHFVRLNYQRLSAAAVLLAVLLSLVFMLLINAFQKRERL